MIICKLSFDVCFVYDLLKLKSILLNNTRLNFEIPIHIDVYFLHLNIYVVYNRI